MDRDLALFNQRLRERVLILLYEKEFRTETYQELDSLLDDTEKLLSDQAIDLAINISDKIADIDEIINEFLENWRFERISSTDKEALRIGIYELIYMKELEPKIVIDRIVRLSKKFGEEESGKFVNGILGAVFRKYIGKDANV
jgi:transcription antitermination protein NusB